MAYIQPNSTIKILTGVPMDNTYEHQIFFRNRQNQTDYFESKVVYSFTQQSYQRVGKNKLRIQILADRLYHCNYMYFKNDLGFEFTPKIFYCFITDVEYINNNVTEITYQIDVMQTFRFDYTLNRCFVEREHSSSDQMFENIVSENLDLGSEYITNNDTFFSMNQMKLCILANRKLAGSSASQTPPSLLINNIYTPVRVFEDFDINSSNVHNIDTYLNSLNENDIICIYQYPSILWKNHFPDITVNSTGDLPIGSTGVNFNTIGILPTANSLVGYQIVFGGLPDVYTVTGNTDTQLSFTPFTTAPVPNGTAIYAVNEQQGPVQPITQVVTLPSDIDGYTPRNRKLYSYPYNKLLVSNHCGEVGEYKWEFLEMNPDTNQTLFIIEGAIVPTPSVLCYPIKYRGITKDWDSGIVYANFPQCAWSGDVFKTWWAQNKASFATSAVSSVISAIGGGITGAMLNTAFYNSRLANYNGASGLNGFGMQGVINKVHSSEQMYNTQQANTAINTGINIGAGIAGSVAKMIDIKNSPSQTHGQLQSDSLNSALSKIGYSFYSVSINNQSARIIDDYFDKFGYATKRVKVPNRAVREEWTYVKTIGCTIESTDQNFSMLQGFEKEITSIYDNGITFWLDPAHIAQYDRSNRPLSEVNS